MSTLKFLIYRHQLKQPFGLCCSTGLIIIAIQLKIPMVLLGENSAYEYSGSSSYDDKFMSEKYFNFYVSNSGHTPKKFSKRFNIPYKLTIKNDKFNKSG